jgi:hypothetical protein
MSKTTGVHCGGIGMLVPVDENDPGVMIAV